MAEERILVVDDEPGVRSALSSILIDEGYDVVTAESGEAGLEAIRDRTFDAVLLDVWLPGIDGLETLQRLRDRRPETEVVMISGHGTIDTAVRATKLGAFDFVEKPLSLEKTLLVLRNALRQRRLEQRNRRLLEQLDRDTEILGQSAAAERLRQQVQIAAGNEAAVLICGEEGSGRETAARRIHAAGRSSDGPFVEVPAGALDAAAAAAALYGEAGRPGRIELALGGTLFVENADRLAPAQQRRLAERLGLEAKRASPLRVCASVGPDAAGLDETLRQRLDVVRIRVPPLRERREDLPLMAERFMTELAREYGRAPKRLTPDSLAALESYGWPGNVRELRNLMERLLLLGAGETVERSELPESLGGAPLAEDLYRDFDSLSAGLRAFERHYIARVMAQEGASRRAAAKRLGITPTSLEKKLKKL